MFKNMRIGMKVASGIGIMIVIILVVMSFVSITLIEIKGNMITLSDEYMKQVEISNKIERTTHNIMYNIRGYGMSQNPEYLETGLALFAENETNLNDAIALASSSADLQAAVDSFNQSKAALLEYKDLVNSTKITVDSYKEAQNTMASSAEVYFKNTDAFLVTQYDSLNTELAQGATTANLQERTQKIKLINEISGLGAETRVNALKAMETKELSYIDLAVESLSKAKTNIAEIRKITYKQNNLDQLDQMLIAANSYGQGVETVKTVLAELSTLAAERESKGKTLIDNSVAMASNGLATTQELAAEINREVQQAIMTMIIGVIISLLIGIVINYFVIVNITKSIRKMTAAADKLAVGDVNVEINNDSKDEIGQLAKSFNNMVEGIKAQSEVVRKIADGENGITVDIRSEEDILNLKLQEAVQNLGVLQAQTEELTAAVEQGNLVKRGDINVLNGIWSDLIKGINNLIDAFVKPINVTNDYITRLGNGDIPPVITDTYYGDFNNIKNSLNNCINSIDNLVEDTNQLIDAALRGKLDTRADENKHNGKYKEIVVGVNQTLDAVIEPVKEASDVLTKMSKGNLNSFVEGEYKGDHAVIKNALNNTINSIRGYISEISEVLNKMSQGDLRTEIKSEFMGDFVGLKESLNHILYRFNEVLGEINVASDQVASASKQVSQSSQALSQGSTEQASSVEEITASITEITEQTRNNADSAVNANNLSQSAMNDAVKGNEQMQEMISAMKDINESSANISKIISVIDEIAFQTNILALNAAVEAARAGQYGKGFAVVAEEVRNLAARSANAAKETTVLIENSIQKVNNGTEIANGTATALAKIVEGVKESSKIVEDISVASKEQADSLVQINEGINQISMVTQSNTATAEESAAASEEMTSQATVLKEMVDRFKLKDVSHSKHSFAQSYVPSAQKNDYEYDEDIQINLDDVEFGKY